jgi:hypothetical protein
MLPSMTILRSPCASFFVLLMFFQSAFAQITMTSPNGKILVEVTANPLGLIQYTVKYEGKEVLLHSNLGIKRGTDDFSINMQMTGKGKPAKISDAYSLVAGKKKNIVYNANQQILSFKNGDGLPLDIEFRISDDGVAFQYLLAGDKSEPELISGEATEFHFTSTARGWLQPMQQAKSGWEQSNPAYEEHYEQDISLNTPSPLKAGWVFPALFKSNELWVLITEAAVEAYHHASRLQDGTSNGIFRISAPDPREIMPGGGLFSKAKLPYKSPWRILVIGSLATIAESTLGTDLALPSTLKDASFVKPGKASWSWINSKDDFIVYDEQKKYIDYAADMQWRYCLIDADWDRKIGYEKIKELADYAKTKNVGLLLWYNSAGSWNTVKYTPKGLLLTHASRVKEFNRLKSIGIKGVKIDFFGGDGQSVMAYYHDILKDAADAGLMVNFHGATLPRGWSRTFPNLLTVEAVRGFEMVTFEQKDADKQANHCTMLPFTRNAFDPMDFTPMNLYKIPTKVERKTSSAFELALSVLFLSGIQHYAESPEGMLHVAADVKEFLRKLPDTWDDVKFIEGYPGKYVVMARKAGNKWYVAGINGSNEPVKVSIDKSVFGKKNGTMLTDGAGLLEIKGDELDGGTKEAVTMKPSGGFVMVME